MGWLHLVLAAVIAVIGIVHGWALKFPAGRVDRVLHWLWQTECKYRRQDSS